MEHWKKTKEVFRSQMGHYMPASAKDRVRDDALIQLGLSLPFHQAPKQKITPEGKFYELILNTATVAYNPRAGILDHQVTNGTVSRYGEAVLKESDGKHCTFSCGKNETIVIDFEGNLQVFSGDIDLAALPLNKTSRLYHEHKNNLQEQKERDMQNLKRVIQISGVAHVGKSTVTQLLVQRFQKQGIAAEEIPEFIDTPPTGISIGTIYPSEQANSTDNWALHQHILKHALVEKLQPGNTPAYYIMERTYLDPLPYALSGRSPAHAVQLAEEIKQSSWLHGPHFLLLADIEELIKRRVKKIGREDDTVTLQKRVTQLQRMTSNMLSIIHETGTIIIDTTKRSPEKVIDIMVKEIEAYYQIPEHDRIYSTPRHNHLYY